ncbi:MAG: bifunctional pyr operon transcriptional regulator/uracil phosphoribosyltransferase PyrR [Candidatus Omnitrophica bacterium]|nr:bifunctional pyr operon transcriptional regulator/uracil phosphoribosyltransferase PyrR [Candidatus Omnitrophota bacterium]
MEYKEKSKIIDSQEICRALKRLAHQILEKNPNPANLALIGIQRRGVFLAKRIQDIISHIKHVDVPLGVIDITLYRDDLTAVGPAPLVRQTQIEFDISTKVVVLVDDVLYTGRTIRCALDEIMDFGRPKRIELAVLIDRGHRELPIRADFVGKNIPTASSEVVEVKVQELDGKDEVVILEKNNE